MFLKERKNSVILHFTLFCCLSDRLVQVLQPNDGLPHLHRPLFGFIFKIRVKSYKIHIQHFKSISDIMLVSLVMK